MDKGEALKREEGERRWKRGDGSGMWPVKPKVLTIWPLTESLPNPIPCQ